MICRMLKRAGYTLVVVTNQSGIAQGLIEPSFVQVCHDEMRARLQRGGADLDDGNATGQAKGQKKK